MIRWLLVTALAAEPAEPADQEVIYYNARMALREGEPLEAVKLWLLRNAVSDLTGEVSDHDADFRSVTWAALGDLGICPDGHPLDTDGAGLWPLALHNWVVENMGRRVPKGRPRPFEAFEVDRQQRFVSVGDVLSARELDAVRLFRGRCLRPRLALMNAGQPVGADLSDRKIAAWLLEHLLQEARSSLSAEIVRGWAVIDARLFDVHLQITALASREARQQASERARRGRQIGLSSGSLAALQEEAPADTLSSGSEAARILRACVGWPASEWMALSPERRLFLFDRARDHGGDPDAMDRISLGVIDQLIDRGQAGEVGAWIARRAPQERPAAQQVIWDGERGQRLLALDPEAGFDERALIALHRGVHHLEQGDLPGSMRSMAYALQHAPESSSFEEIQALSRRWMSYIASQFEITDALLVTLQELLPRQDYAIILEDLIWRAALHADRASFDRGVGNQQGHGALERRAALLRPLADGDIGRFTQAIRSGLAKSPGETLRLLEQLVQRLELEDADVRTSHLTTLSRVRALLIPLADDEEGGRRARTAEALVERSQAIVEGLGGLGPWASARARARSLAPTGEVFAGSVRLAPSDPLPWPFVASEVPAPPIFVPLELTPEEWRSPEGELIFGWRIGG